MTLRERTSMADRRPLFRAVVAALIGMLALTLSPLAARADDQPIQVKQKLALTGVAADADRGLFWGTSSPTTGEVVAIRPDGTVARTVTFSAEVSSLQALAYRGGRLYVGDLGAAKGRSTIQIFRLGGLNAGEQQVLTYTLRYPDGSHDAAAMALSPKGNFYIITRGENPGIYRAAPPVAGGTVGMTRVADAPAGVTDGVFTADGQQMALRAGDLVHLVDAYTFKAVAAGPVPEQTVGEAIGRGLDGSALMVGNGGDTAALVPMALPQGFTTPTPKPSPTPSAKPSTPAASGSAKPSAKPSASGSTSAAPSGEDSSDPKNIFTSQSKGTWIALGSAAGVAVVAGLLTLIRRPESSTDSAEDSSGSGDSSTQR